MHLISTNFENLINLTYNTVYVTRYSKLLFVPTIEPILLFIYIYYIKIYNRKYQGAYIAIIINNILISILTS